MVLRRGFGDGPAAQQRLIRDHYFGDLPPAVFKRKRSQRVAGQRGQSNERRRQGGNAQREDVVDGLPQPGDEVLVEDADDDPNVRIQMSNHQRGRNVDQIVAGEDEHAAGLA